jgi:[acyl-carrier-protein] S-malonyltransferase
MQPPVAPFIANKTGAPVTDIAEIKDELVFQLTHPVRWVQCVEYLAAHGVSAAVEIGPGKVLTGLIKRIAPDMQLQNLGDAAALGA